MPLPIAMHTYLQLSGQWLDPTGKLLTTGYSGLGYAKNNPDMEVLPGLGPIPQGIYTIGQPFDSPKHGPFVMHLEPDPGTQTYGRSGFLLHGDSKWHPGESSTGCIIMPREYREAIWASGDHQLQVLSGMGNNVEAVNRAVTGED